MKKARTFIALILVAVMLCGCTAPLQSFSSEGVIGSIGSFVDSFSAWVEKITEKLDSFLHRKGDSGSTVVDTVQGFIEDKIEDIENALDGKEDNGIDDEVEQSRREMQATRDERIVPFSEMVYSRPDVDGLIDDVYVLEEALEAGTMSLSEIEELIDVVYDDFYHFRTMNNIANVRNCLDLSDEYYAEEYNWCSEQGAVVEDIIDEMYFACGGSKYAMDLEEDYFWEGFAEEYADIADSMYTPELVAMMQEEADLVSEYRDIMSDPVILLDGKEVHVFEGLDSATDSQTYFAILFGYYDKYNPMVSDLFIKLVKLRNAMAKEAGYNDFEEMQYDYYFERDYTPEQAGAYIDDIRRYIVPLAEEIDQKYSYSNIDYSSLSESRLREVLQTVSGNLGGHVEEAYEFMTEYELCDLSKSYTKTTMSFMTYFDEYEAPFLLISAKGTTDDVLTAVHEFGHYCDGYTTYDATDETIDLAEVYSQALEYLSIDMLEDVLSRKAVKSILLSKIIDTVSLYTQQASFAEFEREVYALSEEDLTAEKINEISLRLSKEFGYFTAGFESYYARSWIDINHFFEVPFYVISYPVSNDVAMQIFGLEMEKEGAGVEKYLEMLEHDTGDLLETVEEYGLNSPFDAGSVKNVADLIRDMVKKYEGM